VNAVPLNLCAIAIVLIACSGVPGLFLPRHSPWGQRIATGLVCFGVVFGISGVAAAFFHSENGLYILPWNAAGGSLVGLDALSAFFLVPIFIVGGLGSVYGLGYWPQAGKARTAPKLQFFWGTMMAGMALLVVSAHALACFVKVYGVVFLGLSRSRSRNTGPVMESPASMLIPMSVLALICLAIGLAPGMVLPILEKAIASWLQADPGSLPEPGLAALLPLDSLGIVALCLAGATALFAIIAILSGPGLRRGTDPVLGTWDCGYARPENRMQYTASSLAESLTGLFRWVLKPGGHEARIGGAFPLASSMASHVDEPILDRALIPVFSSIRRGFGWFHRFQQGQTHYYMFYILAALVAMLTTLLPVKDLLAGLFAR
jgi:NADH:ubiquinone oxidoreductase subunit 5 (subunit L)/multisubunit Na+/H+ antiporter MnhA subunit